MGIEIAKRVPYRRFFRAVVAFFRITMPCFGIASMETISILHAPGVKQSKIKYLERKLRDFVEGIDIGKSDIQINPSDLLKKIDSTSHEGGLTLIIGWGLPSSPAWDRWLCENKITKEVRQLLAIDLFERRGWDGRLLEIPYVNAGKYWSRRTRQINLTLFQNGCYIKPSAPFGMKRVLNKRKRERAPKTKLYYHLAPAEPEKVEIVRLIFDLFVNSDYSLTSITNLLNAQGIDPPQKSSTVWNTRIVKGVLESWAYIGSNEYSGCYKHNVFPRVVDKDIFYEAQAKMARKQFDRK
jgi:hypothetical protein